VKEGSAVSAVIAMGTIQLAFIVGLILFMWEVRSLLKAILEKMEAKDG
jgi:hypothetical protein